MTSFIPPSPKASVAAELTVLGSIMRDNGVLDTLTLTPDDFEVILHANTYQAMLDLHAEGKPIDGVTLGNANPNYQGFFWEVGDWAHPGYEFYAEEVRSAAIRRRLVDTGRGISSLAGDSSVSIDEVTERSRKLVDDAVGLRQTPPETSDELVPRVIESIGKAAVGLPTPWRDLTRIIRGFRPGALYIIAARPGVGKSALALQCAAELEKYGSVGYFTIEMGADEVTQRLIAQQAYVPLSEVDGSRRLSPDHKSRIDAWAENYSGRILFDDRGTITMQEIRAQVRTWIRDHNLVGVVVDYIQLVNGPDSWTKLQIVSQVSWGLKMIAKDFGIPVIALSQLNRNPEGRVDKRPALSDLRESGSIEQDADVVMLLYNASDVSGNPGPDGDDLEVIVAKSRQGPTMTAHLIWQGRQVSAFDLK